jgi:hypothetical protein
LTTVKDFRLGADPEFFLKDKETGKFVSAYGLIKGTKHHPQPVNKGAVQVDGTALEYNIEPATTWSEFTNFNQEVQNQLRAMVPDNLSFEFVSVADFGAEYLAAQDEEARKLGCTPDFNAYTGEENPTPDAEMPFRTASGHIHVGWTEGMDIDDPEHLEACRMMVKQLDYVLGTASVVWDPDTTRRKLYGKAGAFRPKPYGVEYRVMSNTWVYNMERRAAVFGAAQNAFLKLLSGKPFFRSKLDQAVQDAINNGDVRQCYYYANNYFDWGNEFHNTYKKWQAANKTETVNRDELGRWKSKGVTITTTKKIDIVEDWVLDGIEVDENVAV